ncbi:MAG: hypothetical protein RL268_64 [Pseudomonadota bacterium]|jgi:ribosomal protein S25
MNLQAFLNRGVRLTGGTELEQRTEEQRKKWLDALLVDETRAWLNLGQSDRSALVGFQTLLTLAVMAHLHDQQKAHAQPAVRVIRGGLSAIEDCVAEQSVITPQHARSLQIAAAAAREMLQQASQRGIQAAAEKLPRLVHQARKDESHAMLR